MSPDWMARTLKLISEIGIGFVFFHYLALCDLLKSMKFINSSLYDSAVPPMSPAYDLPFGRIDEFTECNEAAEEVELADVSKVVAEGLEEEIEMPDHCDLSCAIVSTRLPYPGAFSSRRPHWN
jgi:hypothetical protein